MEHSLFDTYALCCHINAPLCVFPLFISSHRKKDNMVAKVGGGEGGCCLSAPSQLYSSATRASQLFPVVSHKSQPAATLHRDE